jgi:hypothetical protein|tara:strand:+ start:185 stop:1321 length:1137 start_codon:yes stop_codon:yes gene_type:complete
MIDFLKKYRVFVIGYLIAFSITLFIHLNDDIIFVIDFPSFEFFLVLIIPGFLISLPIQYVFVKKDKKPALKVAGLLLFLFITLFIDNSMDFPDNPLVFLLMVMFVIGVVYVLSPSFVIRRRKLILLYFGPLLMYFTYVRLFSGDLETYLKLKNDTNLVAFLFPIPIFIGFCVWTYDQWKWAKSMESGKREAELSLLRSQINPHFFFNTLNNLYALTITKSERAPEVILKLSDMMRYTIYEGEKEAVKLLDEITYLNNYIELHKIRYKKTVEITFNHSADTSLDVAPLMFIILLENAFKHGIESLAENAYIHINLYEDNNFICFDIENNFDPSDENESTGIGLSNLKKRLSLLYKGKYEYTVDVADNVYKTKLKISKDA